MPVGTFFFIRRPVVNLAHADCHSQGSRSEVEEEKILMIFDIFLF